MNQAARAAMIAAVNSAGSTGFGTCAWNPAANT
jgi:hypothetical protein